MDGIAGKDRRRAALYQAGRGLTYAWPVAWPDCWERVCRTQHKPGNGPGAFVWRAALRNGTAGARPNPSDAACQAAWWQIAVAVPCASGGVCPCARPAVAFAAARSRHPLRELALGAMMGFLPCMIPAWALSQAALTGSPLHGALVMLLLVGLTTPILLVATQLPRLLLRLPPLLQNGCRHCFICAPGMWLILVGGAGVSLWPHAHLLCAVWSSAAADVVLAKSLPTAGQGLHFHAVGRHQAAVQCDVNSVITRCRLRPVVTAGAGQIARAFPARLPFEGSIHAPFAGGTTPEWEREYSIEWHRWEPANSAAQVWCILEATAGGAAGHCGGEADKLRARHTVTTPVLCVLRSRSSQVP